MGKPFHHIIILCLVILSNALNGQVLDTVVFSELGEFSKKQLGVSQLETESELIHVIISDNESAVSFVSFDKKSLSKLIDFSWTLAAEGHYDYSIEAVTYFQQKILILTTYVDAQKQEQVTGVVSMNSSGVELGRLELSRQEWNRKETKDYFVFTSPDSSYLGVSSIHPFIAKKKSEVDLYVIDAQLEVTSGASLTLPNIEAIGAPSKFEITNSGEVFFLSGLDKEKAESSMVVGLENRVYQLYRYDWRSEKLKQYDVTISDKFINDVKMKIHTNGDLYVFGLYNYSFDKGVEGVFLMVIDHTSGKIKRSGKKALDVKILGEFISDKRLRKRPSIDDVFLDHFFIQENGNIVFLAEVFKIDQRMITNINGTRITTSKYYNFGDILGVELDASLNYVRHDVVWKNQKSTNHYSKYWSYSVLHCEELGTPVIVYNYSRGKDIRNGHVVTQLSKSETYVRPLFASESTAIAVDERLRVAPFFNSEFNTNYLLLQNRDSYVLGELRYKTE